ncbi:TPA: type III secretion system translocon subunit SctE [Yersinia enterocolitica]|nr:type III secretion system translocon subunit SctE [Yersinia enterocolitica]HDL7833910.1 type III secretion system translocon subunit SctE [Yersinia enterocolitica]HDL7874094.1 type III secretion system translocon subunit SctE [Yersinia enterocolitica]HDL7887335.1 type III secretion system translocon subunit SctE [Yersinia enterocolitica]HDL7896005.1 type III secretion system translocon subunit SctE [Yersinia enterocolitica]
MANITQTGSERINNIRTFTQGVNINQIRDDSTKNLLGLEDACRELASTEQERRSAKEGAPRLVSPKMTLSQARFEASAQQQSSEAAGASAHSATGSEKTSKTSGFNAAASLLGSMGTLRQLLHDGNLAELRGRLQMINSESSALREQGEKLLSAFENSNNQLQNARDETEEYRQAWEQSKKAVNDLTLQKPALQEKLGGNQQKLATAEKILAQATSDLKALPTPPQTQAQQTKFEELTDKVTGLNIRLNALQANHQTLSNSLTVLDSKLTEAKLNSAQLESTYKQALTQSTTIAVQADNNRKAINQFIDDAPRPPQIEGERWENALGMLTLLTAQLKKALNDDSIKNMKQQQEVMETINEATRKDSEKKAKEAAEAEAKADEANKAASCASKVFGYIMLAVSVVATIASLGTAGPLMLAVAAIGIAMTVADIILEETGNSSLMQMLAAEISTGVTNLLVSFGVPEEKAKEIGSIMGMVLAAVAFLAVSLFSMSSFAKNIGQTAVNVAKNASKQVANLMKSAVKALPRDFVNTAAKMGSKATNLSKPLAKIADKADDVTKVTNVTARKVEMGLNGSNIVLGVTSAAVSGGLNLHASSMIRDMKELLADMMLNNAVIQAIDELLKALIKGMSKSYDQINEMFEGMLTALNESGTAKANMMKSSFA